MRGSFSRVLLTAGCAAIAIWAGAAKPASANTYQINFGASDFPSSAPTSFVLGQVEVSFDPSSASPSSPFIIGSAKLDFLNLNVADVGYFYNAAEDALIVGGNTGTPNGLVPGTDDFLLIIQSLNTAPTFGTFEYSFASSSPNLFIAHDGEVHVAVSTTPIPGALPLFVSALGGLGFIGWRRRKMAA